jgi:hypothetical protein
MKCCFEKVLEATPPDHPRNAAMLNAVAICLAKKCQKRHDSEDLKRAIQMSDEAYAADPTSVKIIQTLGLCYELRYSDTNDPGDLKKAIEFGEKTLYQIPLFEDDRATRTYELAVR